MRLDNKDQVPLQEREPSHLGSLVNRRLLESSLCEGASGTKLLLIEHDIPDWV